MTECINDRPDVTIVAPVYNVENFLRKSVGLMLAQTHKNIEIILVDDGSTDKSGAICDEFAEKDPRVKVIHKQNEGVGEARNTGMDAASGEYIYFCDPDDFIELDLIEDNYRLAKENNADVVKFGCWSQKTDENGNILSERKDMIIPSLDGAYSYEEFWKNYEEAENSQVSVWVHLYRMDYLRKNSLRSTNLSRGQDAYFFFDFLATKFNTFVFNRKRYYTYNVRPGSKRTTFKLKAMECDYQVYQRYAEVLGSSPIDAALRNKLVAFHFCLIALIHSSALVCKGDFSKKEKVKILKDYISRPEFRSALKYFSEENCFDTKDRIALFMMRHGFYKSFVEVRSIMGPGRTGM